MHVICFYGAEVSVNNTFRQQKIKHSVTITKTISPLINDDKANTISRTGKDENCVHQNFNS
jgi:hypothetical protein